MEGIGVGEEIVKSGLSFFFGFGSAALCLLLAGICEGWVDCELEDCEDCKLIDCWLVDFLESVRLIM